MARSSTSTADAPPSERRRDDPRHHSRQSSDTKPLGCSLTILLARNPDKVAGCGPVAEIAALIDVGELRLDISERELLTDTAAIHERAEAGDLRGRVVLIPEG